LMDDDVYTDEDIGDGNGINTSPTLTNLANGTNGIVGSDDYKPVVTATCGSTERTVNIAPDGTCSGYCSAGELDMTDGTWTTDITWTTAPDNSTDIEITYREKHYTYSGNVVTIGLDTTVANSYTTATTWGSGCLQLSDIQGTSDSWVETSTSGTYDETTYPLEMYNEGADYDTITLTFSSATAFTVVGTNMGSLGAGTITSDFEPTNPWTGETILKLDKDGWAGTWAGGDTVTFTIYPAAAGVWWKEIVPAATSAEAHNCTVLGWYGE